MVWVISRLKERLLAPEEGLCYMQLDGVEKGSYAQQHIIYSLSIFLTRYKNKLSPTFKKVETTVLVNVDTAAVMLLCDTYVIAQSNSFVTNEYVMF